MHMPNMQLSPPLIPLRPPLTHPHARRPQFSRHVYERTVAAVLLRNHSCWPLSSQQLLKCHHTHIYSSIYVLLFGFFLSLSLSAARHAYRSASACVSSANGMEIQKHLCCVLPIRSKSANSEGRTAGISWSEMIFAIVVHRGVCVRQN